MNVLELRNAFEDYKGENITDEKFYKWLNYAEKWLYEQLVRIEPEKFIKTQSYSVSGGTVEYDLPSDFAHINSLNCGFFSVNSAGDPVSKFFTTEYGASAPGFYLAGDKVHFTGNLNGSFLLRYIPNIAELDADTDTLTGDYEFKIFYEQALDQFFAIDDEELEDEENSQNRLKKILENLFSTYNRNIPLIHVSCGDFY